MEEASVHYVGTILSNFIILIVEITGLIFGSFTLTSMHTGIHSTVNLESDGCSVKHFSGIIHVIIGHGSDKGCSPSLSRFHLNVSRKF